MKGWIENEWVNIWSEIWRWSLNFSSIKIHTEAQTTRLKTSQDFFVSWPWHLTRIVRWSRWKARFRFLLAFNSMLPFISRQTYPFYKTLYQDGVHQLSCSTKKVNNRNTRKRCEIYSNLIKRQERRHWSRSGVFIKFEHTLHSIVDFEQVNSLPRIRIPSIRVVTPCSSWPNWANTFLLKFWREFCIKCFSSNPIDYQSAVKAISVLERSVSCERF